MQTEYPTDANMDNYPYIILTADTHWDPSVYDNPAMYDPDGEVDLSTPVVNDYGKLVVAHATNHDVCTTQVAQDHHIPEEELTVDHNACIVQKSQVTCQLPDLEKLHPYLGWTPLDHVKHMIDATTQYAHTQMLLPTLLPLQDLFPCCQRPHILMRKWLQTHFFLMSLLMIMASWDMVGLAWLSCILVS